MDGSTDRRTKKKKERHKDRQTGRQKASRVQPVVKFANPLRKTLLKHKVFAKEETLEVKKT